MRNVIKVNVYDSSSIENAIQELEKSKDRIERFTKEIVKEASELGVAIASVNFSEAIYAGVNDAIVSYEISDDGRTATISANGQSVLFIEFGTGLYKASAPNEEAEIISGYVMPHGTYGQGRGSNPSGWAFAGSMNGTVPSDTHFIRNGVYHTYGNDANSSLWNAKNELMKMIPNIVRRIAQ